MSVRTSRGREKKGFEGKCGHTLSSLGRSMLLAACNSVPLWDSQSNTFFFF